ncbi:MAG: hypothetical protein JSS79_20245 [Bacteroidetes bacterium]|nr:hypothetical protein [Bacteroidota bacterium]
MKKLDDIPKQNIFEVPDGYFDRLPMKIQSRIEASRPAPATAKWSLALRLALPALILIVGVIYFLNPKVSGGTEDLLASINTENLIAYLDESDLTESELLEAVKFDEIDADSLNLQMHSDFLLGGVKENELNGELENEL